jgi:hypothetical protein
MAGVLRHGASSAQVKLLVDGAATKYAILKELKWLATRAGLSDTAIVFFSGHGGKQSAKQEDNAYFLPFDASPSAIDHSFISSNELTEALRAIRSTRLVVFLDTCYSGGIGEPRNRGFNLEVGLSSRDVSGLIEGRGRVIIAASRPDEPSWEFSYMRNGLFTNYVLSALRGEIARSDGTIWISELFSYISRNVRQHRCQHPYQKSIGEDFVVMTIRDLSNQSERIQSLLPQIDQRSLRIAMHKTYNRAELSILCRDLGINLEDLSGNTLETQLLDLIDHCHRHGMYDQLLERVREDRPHFAYS